MRIWTSAICLILAFCFGPALRADDRIPSAEQCQILLPHVPDSDVTYRPSPDMVPADLSPQGPAPDKMTLDLKGPVIGAGAGTSANTTLSRQLVVGQVMIELDAQGRASLSMNGRPLSANDQAQMIALCRQRR